MRCYLMIRFLSCRISKARIGIEYYRILISQYCYGKLIKKIAVELQVKSIKRLNWKQRSLVFIIQIY